MSYLAFEDDELDIMLDIINKMQICFHPRYARDGHFSIHDIFDLQSDSNDILIIADKNIVSPICEIAATGSLKNQERMQKVAFFITWSKFINARVTCGLGLLENDTSGLCSTNGEAQRQQFLHAVDSIPAMMWKNLAFGYIDRIPELYIFKGEKTEKTEYVLNDDLLLLTCEAAIIKIVEILKSSSSKPIDRFISFMNWYTDNLDIADSIVAYAAMAFTNAEHVSLPQKSMSPCYEEVYKGILNQSWDITYIVTWSQQYYKESNGQCWMFATDDITQKAIVVNTIPPGEISNAICAAFPTRAEIKKLEEFESAKLGNARVRPFQGMSEEEKITAVKQLITQEQETLKKMCVKE